MMGKLSPLLLILLVLAAGCGHQVVRATLPNLVVPASCASEITLVECETRVNPPKCKRARVRYRVGCEQVVVAKSPGR